MKRYEESSSRLAALSAGHHCGLEDALEVALPFVDQFCVVAVLKLSSLELLPALAKIHKSK